MVTQHSSSACRWPQVKLAAHVDLLTGYPFRSSEYTANQDGIRLLRGDNVGQGFLRWDGVKKWPCSDAKIYASFELGVGDVILAMDRPWIEAGLKYAYITSSDLPALLVQRVARLRGCNGLATDFLRYLIGSPAFTGHVHTITTGTAVPHISAGDIRDFEFLLPPLPIQRKIAAILSAYDDLIENNTRRIALLEAMAQALYREWFVHFRFPGHQSVPLVDSLLGLIPDGWYIGRLDDPLLLQRGFDLPASQRREGEIPVFAATGKHGYHDKAKVSGPGVVTGRSGSLGSVSFVHEDFWPLNTTLWVKEYRHSTPAHAFYVLSSLDFSAFNSGAAVPTLNRNDVHGLPVIVPPVRLVEVFDDQALVLS